MSPQEGAGQVRVLVELRVICRGENAEEAQAAADRMAADLLVSYPDALVASCPLDRPAGPRTDSIATHPAATRHYPPDTPHNPPATAEEFVGRILDGEAQE